MKTKLPDQEKRDELKKLVASLSELELSYLKEIISEREYKSLLGKDPIGPKHYYR